MENQEDTMTKKRSRLRFFYILFFSVILITIFFGILSYMYFSNQEDIEVSLLESTAELKNGIMIDIPLGSSTDSIAKLLKQKGIISSPLAFKYLSKINGFDGSYKAGTHVVSNELDYKSIMRILSNNPKTIKLTIPEGYNINQIAKTMVDKKLISSVEKFNQIADTENFDYKFVKDITRKSNRLEGYLFPDTYEFNLKNSEKDIINAMLENFNNKYQQEFYKKAEKLNMTLDKIIILASIIEKEAKLPEERKLISGVFYNRLNNKNKYLRKLQSCATIQYIIFQKDGKVKEQITEKDTQINNPYNTYKNEGLPPGPICSPGRASIEAALNPQQTSYLYFVAKGDGSHVFSKTLEEHTSAVKAFSLN